MCSLAFAAPARADEQFDVGPAPVLNVHVIRGKVTVQTWDRQQVLISSDNAVNVRHVAASEVEPGVPKQLQFASQRIMTEHGPVELPAESFVLPELPGSQHDAVMAQGRGNVTITIPRNTAMVVAHVRAGHLTLDNYHGIFVTRVRAAGISLNHVGGTGFVESLRGRIVGNRLDASTGCACARRSETCSSRAAPQQQIEATSTYGSIVYDDGQFPTGSRAL